MSYNKYYTNNGNGAYNAMNEISWAKKDWTNGDASTKDWAAGYAKPQYQKLYDTGHGEAADFLKNSNADQSYGYQKGYQYGMNYNPYSNQRVDMDNIVSTQRNAANSVIDSGYKNMQAQTQKQIDDVNARYLQSNKALYNDYLQSQAKLPQQLSAMGYTGGATETTLARAMSDYNASLGNLNAQKQADISALNTELLKAYNDANAQKAQNEADYTRMWLDQYNTDADRAINDRYTNAQIKNMEESQAQGWAGLENDKAQADWERGYKDKVFDWEKSVDDRDFNYGAWLDNRDFGYGQNQDNIKNYLTFMGMDPDRVDMNKAAEVLGTNNPLIGASAGTYKAANTGGNGSYYTAPVVGDPLGDNQPQLRPWEYMNPWSLSWK